ncbi:unnamed protein product [Calypogeia fissa]
MPTIPTPIGSASFYPIKGLFFFLRDENRVVLWKRIAKFTAEVGVAAVAICGSLFRFTFYTQQGVVLKVLPHFFGTPGTIILILIETAIPLTLFFYKRMQRVQQKLFVDVLSIQGIKVEKASADEREWIDEQREIQRRETQGQRPNILRYLADPATMYDRPLTKYLVTLPLNFVPVAGQAAFCWVNSMDMSTPLHHYYYSKLKGLTAEEEAAVIYYRRKQYEQFGLTATALSLFPGADIVLLLTNAVGAALWAADIEKAMAKRRKL